MEEKIIQIEDVYWLRKGKEILHAIDWTVQKGEHWAVLGLNGSGKTTLLNMINGYIWPTKGAVEVLGCQFGRTNIHNLRKRIGWVSSSLSERIHYRVKTDDLVISGKYASVGQFDTPTKDDYEKAKHLMQQLHISYLSGRWYESCSQGEKQKILIARALMADPELLILDEPTNGLDFLAREELLETIANLANETDGPTLIFVTHHIEEITPEFSHSLLIQDGTVLSKGKNEDVLTSKGLSELFKTEVDIQWQNNRAWLQRIDKEKS